MRCHRMDVWYRLIVGFETRKFELGPSEREVAPLNGQEASGVPEISSLKET